MSVNLQALLDQAIAIAIADAVSAARSEQAVAYEATIAQRDAVIAGLNADRDQLQLELDDLEDEVQQAHLSLTAAEAEVAAKAAQIATLNAEIATLSARIEELENPPIPPAKVYYIAPNGSDSNAGTKASPWLTPKHNLTAGDRILGVPGTYNAANFAPGDWGTVTMPSARGEWMAIVEAEIPFTCYITSPNACVRIDQSGWALSGFRVKNTSDVDGALVATPSGPYNIHHVGFFNNIIEGAYRNGISIYGYTGNKAYGVDYIAIIGNAIFDAAKGWAFCHSGISIYQPIAYDTQPGVHILVAGNFSCNNKIPGTGCANGTSSDGNGAIADDWSCSQSPGVPAYAQKGVFERNICVGNDSAGISVFKSSAATIELRNNTAWSNFNKTMKSEFYAGEFLTNGASGGSVTWTDNIGATPKLTENGPSHYNMYGCFVGSSPGTTVKAMANLFSRPSGTAQSSSGSTGFAYGANSNGNPNFVNPHVPTLPSVTTETTTVQLMEPLIAGFVAQAPEAAGKGYRRPNVGTASADYPEWLRGVVPPGLIPIPAGY